MSKSLKIAAVLVMVLIIAEPSWAQRFVYRPAPRAVIVQPYYGYGPGWYGYGWYGPWWGPGLGVNWGPAYVMPRQQAGEVKLITRMKEASVYVDGGFAGTAGHLKHFYLAPGNHNIELRNPSGQVVFHEQVHVILDKTAEIHVD